MRFYHWLHIPTGKTGISEWFGTRSREAALEQLNQWNQSPDWKYWTD